MALMLSLKRPAFPIKWQIIFHFDMLTWTWAFCKGRSGPLDFLPWIWHSARVEAQRKEFPFKERNNGSLYFRVHKVKTRKSAKKLIIFPKCTLIHSLSLKWHSSNLSYSDRVVYRWNAHKFLRRSEIRRCSLCGTPRRFLSFVGCFYIFLF